MGRKKCGCYDGPFSSEMPKTLVSVRCHLHPDLPASRGHSLMVLGENGRMVMSKPVDKLDGWKESRMRDAANRKRYASNERVI